MKVVCYGEILWDIFEDKKTIGGATFNVAGHFSRLGDKAYMISAVGNDTLGREALSSLDSIGVERKFIKTIDYETGKAYVTLLDGSPSYSFNTPCAWDYISLEKKEEEKLFSCEWDVFVYGTLSQRGKTSHETLRKILAGIKAKEFFFDVNFRLGYYSKEVIDGGLEKATILKVNEDEEKVILSLFSLSSIKELFDIYHSLKMIIMTYGRDGSVVLTRNEKYISKPDKVSVVDTVGAGDSFSASFLHFLIAGESVESALRKATIVSSYVVEHRGAIPEYSLELKKKLSLS